MTISQRQCDQVEMQSKLALAGGELNWNAWPIGEAVGMNIPNANSKKEQFDLAMIRRAQRVSSGMLSDEPEDSGFTVEHPLRFLQTEAERADRDRHKLVAEKSLTAASYKGIGPKNALAVRQFLALLDKSLKKSREGKRPASSAVSADEAEERNLLRIIEQGVAARGRIRRASSGRSTSMGSRSSSMDAAAAVSVEALMPAGAESLKSWFGWIARSLNQFTEGYQAIRRFLFYNPGKTLYRDLPADKKLELHTIVAGIVLRNEA